MSTVRIDTTATAAESMIWSPTGPVTVQVAVSETSTATVELLVSAADEAAPWVRVAAAKAAREALLHFPLAAPFVKVVMHSNRAGDPVKVWSF